MSYPVKHQVCARTTRIVILSRDQGFFVEARANLDTTIADDLLVEGTVKLQSGNFRVFGKRFEIRSGSMVFEGDPTWTQRWTWSLATRCAEATTR